MCRLASTGIVIAAAIPEAASPNTSPAPASVISLAASTRPRRGVISTAGTMVLCRNSVVTASAPAISAKVCASPASASVARAGLPSPVYVVARAVSATAATISTRAPMASIRNVRVVASLATSARMSLVMTDLSPCSCRSGEGRCLPA